MSSSQYEQAMDTFYGGKKRRRRHQWLFRIVVTLLVLVLLLVSVLGVLAWVAWPQPSIQPAVHAGQIIKIRKDILGPEKLDLWLDYTSFLDSDIYVGAVQEAIQKGDIDTFDQMYGQWYDEFLLRSAQTLVYIDLGTYDDPFRIKYHHAVKILQALLYYRIPYDYEKNGLEGVVENFRQQLILASSIVHMDHNLYPDVQVIAISLERAVYNLNDPEVEEYLFGYADQLIDELIFLPVNYTMLSFMVPDMGSLNPPTNFFSRVASDYIQECAYLSHILTEIEEPSKFRHSLFNSRPTDVLAWLPSLRRRVRNHIERDPSLLTEESTIFQSGFLDGIDKKEHIYLVAPTTRKFREYQLASDTSRLFLMHALLDIRISKRLTGDWPSQYIIADEDLQTVMDERGAISETQIFRLGWRPLEIRKEELEIRFGVYNPARDLNTESFLPKEGLNVEEGIDDGMKVVLFKEIFASPNPDYSLTTEESIIFTLESWAKKNGNLLDQQSTTLTRTIHDDGASETITLPEIEALPAFFKTDEWRAFYEKSALARQHGEVVLTLEASFLGPPPRFVVYLKTYAHDLDFELLSVFQDQRQAETSSMIRIPALPRVIEFEP